MIGERSRSLNEPAVQWGTLAEPALDLATPSRSGSKLEMQMSPMVMQTARENLSTLEWQTAKDWASAWESAEAG